MGNIVQDNQATTSQDGQDYENKKDREIVIDQRRLGRHEK